MQYTLRELRAKARMTQKQVAEAIGVNTATYNAWEAISAEDVRKLAELFGVKTDAVLLAD